ncbi:MAG: hypothetical protein Q8L75_17870 [Acidobacteriota bacterium]|nr:hypothetical protein [Acidobacteriota bacterium]
MRDAAATLLDDAGRIVSDLTKLGLEPILVGGMALVTLGSRRVTRDFDFVVPVPGDRLEALVGVFYDRGLELAARVNESGDITATIDNRKVACIRLRLDAPFSAYFSHPKTGLRVDLLFDFPVPASQLAADATRITIRSRGFLVASEGDLLNLKRLARANRTAPGDAEDLAFLEARRARL